MADQPTRFPAEKLHWYPHMFPLDIAIWERFIANYASSYSSFQYDVKVGTGTKPPEGATDTYIRMQEVLSKYRIDVVGHRSNRLDIIEVKPEASTVAIGQIVAYVTLYLRDFRPTVAVKGVIVTDRELPDIRELTQAQNIDYFVV